MLVQKCHSQQDFYLSANKIIKNDKESIVLAEGSVEIQYDKVKLKSDTLTFNTKKMSLAWKEI